MVNNAHWLVELRYIDFLREIGKHFSVNRMLAAESYRARMQTGLSFIEFNYMLLQAYDFWHLFKHYDCRLQMGGNDQWGNILAGADLTRRLEGETVHGLTFPAPDHLFRCQNGEDPQGRRVAGPRADNALTTTISTGSTRTTGMWGGSWPSSPSSPWTRCVASVRSRGKRSGRPKRFLPLKQPDYATASRQPRRQGRPQSACSGTCSPNGGPESVPTVLMKAQELEAGIPVYLLFERTGLCRTRAEARRLITQGGGYVNGQRVEAFDQVIESPEGKAASLLLRAGKKRYIRVQLT